MKVGSKSRELVTRPHVTQQNEVKGQTSRQKGHRPRQDSQVSTQIMSTITG